MHKYLSISQERNLIRNVETNTFLIEMYLKKC